MLGTPENGDLDDSTNPQALLRSSSTSGEWDVYRWIKALRSRTLEIKEIYISSQGQDVDVAAMDLLIQEMNTKVNTFSVTTGVVVVLDLSLENSSLNDDAFILLLDYLSMKCPLFHLRRLKVYKNNLTDVSIIALSKFILERHPYPVHELHLSHNWFKDAGAKRLLQAIKTAIYLPPTGEVKPIYPRRSSMSLTEKSKFEKVNVIPVWIRWERNCIENPVKICNEVAEGVRGNFLCTAPNRLERHRNPKTPTCSPTLCLLNRSKRDASQGDIVVHLHMYVEQDTSKTKPNSARKLSFSLNRCTIEIKPSPREIYLKRGCHPYLRQKELPPQPLQLLNGQNQPNQPTDVRRLYSHPEKSLNVNLDEHNKQLKNRSLSCSETEIQSTKTASERKPQKHIETRILKSQAIHPSERKWSEVTRAVQQQNVNVHQTKQHKAVTGSCVLETPSTEPILREPILNIVARHQSDLERNIPEGILMGNDSPSLSDAKGDIASHSPPLTSMNPSIYSSIYGQQIDPTSDYVPYNNMGHMNNLTMAPPSRPMNLSSMAYKMPPYQNHDANFRMNEKSFDLGSFGYTNEDPHIFIPKSLMTRCVNAFEKLVHLQVDIPPHEHKLLRESRQIIDTLHWHLHNSAYQSPPVNVCLGLDPYANPVNHYNIYDNAQDDQDPRLRN